MIRIPQPTTLKKYGLSRLEWSAILSWQGDVCAICKKQPDSGRLVTDHKHVKGWKKMPPERRKLHVRGILCWFCNSSYMGKGMTLSKALNMVEYLRAYQLRLSEKS